MRDPDAETHFNRGLELSKQKHAEEALASFRKAIKFAPDYAEAYYNAGVVLNNLGRLEEAAEAFRSVVRIKPELPEGYFNLGAVYGVMGRKEESVEMLKRAVSLRPDLFIIRIHRFYFSFPSKPLHSYFQSVYTLRRLCRST